MRIARTDDDSTGRDNRNNRILPEDTVIALTTFDRPTGRLPSRFRGPGGPEGDRTGEGNCVSALTSIDFWGILFSSVEE